MDHRQSERSIADYELEWQLIEDLQINNTHRPIKDPTSAGLMFKTDLKKNFTLEYGVVVQSMPNIHNYRVIVEGCKGIIWCTNMMDTGGSAVGARPLASIPEGAHVIIAKHQFLSNIGLIVGVVPQAIRSVPFGIQDYLTQTSASGTAVDHGYMFPFTMQASANLENRSDRRPIDSIPIGEWGAITETGSKIFLDPFMASVGMDEETNFSVYYHNQLARVSGHNLELRSAGHENKLIDDQCEVTQEEHDTPYYWEGLGCYSFGALGYGTLTPKDYQISEPWNSAIEPTHPDQQSIYRRMSFGGYLGQGGKRYVIVPDPHKSGSSIEQLSQQSNHPAVFAEDISLTGRYSLRSAKAISITKRVNNPAPKRMKLPDDTTGDNETNYKAAGIIGSGPAHGIVDEITSSIAPTNGIRASSIIDMHAYIYNKEATFPFEKHVLDWYVPEECTYTSVMGKTVAIPDYIGFTGSTANQYLSEPNKKQVTIDHRYGPSNYYEGEAGFDITEDGSVVLYDAYGSEIILSGGNITISAAGDIFLRSGRNTVTMAGQHAIVKAKNDVELSSTDRHVRIKGQKNVMILGGNGGCGGILLHCKSTCPAYDYSGSDDTVVNGGVVVMTKDSDFIVKSNGISLKTKQDGIHMLVDPGGHIKTTSDYFERTLRAAALDYFGLENQAASSVNEWWAADAFIGSRLRVYDKVVMNNGLVVNGWIAAKGHIATSESVNNNALVNQLLDAEITTLTNEVRLLTNRQDYLVNTFSPLATDVIERFVNPKWNLAEFSFNNSYGSQVIILESRWQQLARQAGISLRNWVEGSVVTINGPNYPYPGKANTVDNSVLYQIDSKFFNFRSGCSQPRTDTDYNSPTFNAPAQVGLSAYTILGDA